MTTDYKQNILEFMTGNLPENSSVYDPQFQHLETKNNNLYNQIKQYFSSRVAYVGFIPSKNNKNQDLDYSILAVRGTLNNRSDESGAIVILDKNYNIVRFITRYSDTTLIGVIHCINIDEKGNYYIVEEALIPSLAYKFRIVLLNNIAVKPSGSNINQVIKVQSIRIPTQYNFDSFIKVFKNEANNKYFAIGVRPNTEAMIGCEVTTGETETWTYYTTNYSKQASTSLFDNGFNVYWDSEGKLHFNIAVNNYGLVILSNGEGAMEETRITNDSIANSPNNTFIYYSNQIGYYATLEVIDNVTQYTIYKVNLTTNEVNIIYTRSATYSNRNALWFFKNKNAICFILIAYNGSNYRLRFGLIDGIATYEISLGTFTADTFLDAFCYPNVISIFNKNYVYVQNQNQLFTLDFNWRNGEYNGEPYISSASLIPSFATIEDENDNEILNKSLYNLSNYANRYIATMQIPNYFLNDVEIPNALLYSQGNNLLVEDTIDITKNIYEEVNINFINQFNMIDNDSDTENILGASELLEAMFQRRVSAYLGKYQINYADSTTDVKLITTSDLVYDDLSITLKFMVYVDKQINSIDLISNDELITYKTIDTSQLDIGKYYLISQDVRIE